MNTDDISRREIGVWIYGFSNEGHLLARKIELLGDPNFDLS